MKDVTKGILIAITGAIICRECYACGYNKGWKDCLEKLNLMVKVKEAVEKECKGES